MIRNIPDFPEKGIQFKDITTVIKDKEALKWLCQTISETYMNKGITKVLGLESRGFILAPAIAMEIGAGFVPVRKPGKLPAKTIAQTYQKEYGQDKIEIHEDAICKDDIILIHDDLLATGGTINAAIQLVKKMGVKKIYANFLIELDELEGAKTIDEDVQIDSLIHL